MQPPTPVVAAIPTTPQPQILTENHTPESDINFARIFIAGFQGLNHVTVESIEPTYVAERRSNANVYVQYESANINSANVPRGQRNTTAETASSQDQVNSMPQNVQPIKL
jgi:hypothetical protein